MRNIRERIGMAYIEVKSEERSGRTVGGQFGFTLIAGIAVIALMLFFSENRMSDAVSIFAIVSVIASVVILVQYKLNPKGWMKIFNRRKFEMINRQDMVVLDILNKLDDSYFILSDFSFELFHIDHLVISKNGVFVIDKIRDGGELKIDNGILFAGDKSLETLTGRIWKISHLVNIITRKGFKNEGIMPRPILVQPDRAQSEIKEFNGIRISGVDELYDVLKDEMKFSIESGIAEGLAMFAKERYMN